MAAYIIVRADVTDPERYAVYARHTPRLLAEYQGRFIARGGNVETIEGEPEQRRVVVVEFPDADTARRFYQSADYQRILGIRQTASRSEMILVDGFPSHEWEAAVAKSNGLTLDDDPDVS